MKSHIVNLFCDRLSCSPKLIQLQYLTDILELKHDTRIFMRILSKAAYVFISGASFSFLIITFSQNGTLFCLKSYELRSFRLRFFDAFLTPNFRNSLVHKFSPSLTSYLCLNWFV
jgi:hypothetical protein